MSRAASDRTEVYVEVTGWLPSMRRPAAIARRQADRTATSLGDPCSTTAVRSPVRRPMTSALFRPGNIPALNVWFKDQRPWATEELGVNIVDVL